MFIAVVLALCLTAVNTLDKVYTNFYLTSLETQKTNDSVERAANEASHYTANLMLQEMQQTADGTIYIEPEFLWEEYKFAFLTSLGLYSEDNMKLVEHYLPVSVIAVNDGYFMRLYTYNDVDVGYYKWTQKIPYSRETSLPTSLTHNVEHLVNPVPAGYYVADTMSGTNISVYNKNVNEYYVVQTDGNRLQSVEGSLHYKPAIAQELLDAILYCINTNTASDSVLKSSGGLSIPTAISDSLDSEEVPLLGPSIFVIGDSFNWVSSEDITFTAVANTQIISSVPIYCYTRDGVKYYSRNKPTSVPVEQIYSNTEQAAVNGYQYDVENK